MCFPPKSVLWAAGHMTWQNKRFQTNAPALPAQLGFQKKKREWKKEDFFFSPNGSENCSQPGWIDNSILLKLRLAAKRQLVSENQPSPHPARWKRTHSPDLQRGAEVCVGQRNSEMLSNVPIHSCGPKWRSKKTVLTCLKKKLARKIK